MQRNALIQRIWQQVSGGYASDDSMLTPELINQYVGDGIGIAAQLAYVGSIKLDGIAYINNSFAYTYSGLTITQEDIFTYKVALPQIPFALGQNEGLQSLKIQSDNPNGATGKSYDCIPMTLNQISINNGRRKIFGKYEYWYEGEYAYVQTTGQDLSIGFTAIARLISGGDSSDLTSTVNIPDDYIPTIIQYVQKQLGIELMMPQDVSNDGVPNNTKQ